MARANHANRVALGAALVLAWFSVSWERRGFLDRPLTSITIALFLSSATLLLVSHFYPRDLVGHNGRKGEDHRPILPKEEYKVLAPSLWDQCASWLGVRTWLQSCNRRHGFIAIVGCIVVRVALLNSDSAEAQCTHKNFELIFLPPLLGIHHYFTTSKSYSGDDEIEKMEWSIFQDIHFYLTHSRASYLVPTLLLSLGIILADMDSLPSSYICNVGSDRDLTLVISQAVGVALDAVTILGSCRLLRGGKDGTRNLNIIIRILAFSAFILGCMGTASAFYQSISVLSTAGLGLNWLPLKDGIAIAIALLCVIYLAAEVQMLALAVISGFAIAYAPLLQSLWPISARFPPQPRGLKTLALFLVFIGFTAFMHIYSVSGISKSSYNFARRVPHCVYILLTISFLTAEGTYLFHKSVVESHPINSLMYLARIESDRWRVNADSSTFLASAVAEYQSRYRGRLPPPNFDKWYNFAKEKGCSVIDNYDQIDRDLLPFWALEPSEIRRRTPERLPGNGIALLTIRNGHAEATSLHPEYRGMSLEETVMMINEFSEWLPDMDIAINAMETPRIALAWGDIEPMRQRGMEMKSQAKQLKNRGFSSILNPPWPSPTFYKPTIETLEKVYRDGARDASLLPSIYNRVSAACSPRSPSARTKAWNMEGFCASCASPHSVGQFLRDWTLAGDLCGQPDMRNLETFLVSPDNTHGVGKLPPDLLLPVFSRSKVHGYNDILFPSSDDFMNLSKDFSGGKLFSELQNSLYWRGETTDESGLLSRTWRAATPQRLVNLVNNFSSSTAIPMLLPAAEEGKFVYESVLAGQLSGHLNIDVGFTKSNCYNSTSCQEQDKRFGTKPAASFEQNFDHRYIFDTDDQGPSKNFLSFLRSNALPFRASIFRSWYDDRLTPWVHFVPVDGRLHAIHSTLAYFTGLKGNLNRREIDMPGRFGQAMFIADQGRKWAEKAIRREDAQAYMFRLLLEWGRLIDDQRDELGFQIG